MGFYSLGWHIDYYYYVSMSIYIVCTTIYVSSRCSSTLLQEKRAFEVGVVNFLQKFVMKMRQFCSTTYTGPSHLLGKVFVCT